MKNRIILLLALVATLLGCSLLTGEMGEVYPQRDIPLELQVYGQDTLLSDSPYSLRVVVRDHIADRPLAGAKVGVVLQDPRTKKAKTLFVGETDSTGTLPIRAQLPDLEEGDYELAVVTWGRHGYERVESSVRVRRQVRLLLVTDKPLYQPRQTIHIRALALRRPRLQPEANSPITFEVDDSKGNKVFKKATTTSKFGIASADFTLAEEVNLGSYKVRAILGKRVEEKTVTVKRYVLPKFKLTLQMDKTYYLPGEEASGTVRAEYFFGKPVSDGRVQVKVSTFDVSFHEIANLQGRTDENGAWHFEVTLPEHFVGTPLEQGDAFLQLEVSVTDQADHKEQITQTTTVAAQPIRITVIPESGELVPGVENILYVMTTYPDGRPVKGRVKTRSWTDPIVWDVRETDELGIVALRFQAPSRPEDLQPLMLLAEDTEGRHFVVGEFDLPFGPFGTDALLLRTNEALYKVGEDMRLTVLSPAKRGTIYLDLIKDRQTMLTKSVELRNGRADLRIGLTPDLTGTLEIHAYRLRPDGNIVRDTKIVYVSSADDLTIEVSKDKETYLPAQEAKLSFKVTDPRGHPVLAALGLSIVDESVFALQEMQPGLEKVYFTLEKELMEPKYEIHQFAPGLIVRPISREEPAKEEILQRKRKAAKVLFAAAEPLTEHSLKANSYEQWVKEHEKKWSEAMADDILKMGEAVKQWYEDKKKHPEAKKGLAPLVKAGYLKQDEIEDLWGTEYQIVPYEWTEFPWQEVRSAGPDRRFETIDDIDLIKLLLTFHEKIQRQFGRFHWAEGGEREGLFLDGMVAGRLMLAEALPKAVAEAPAEAAKPVRVRKYFPETLYWNPALITDEKGQASLTLTMADSITTWRLTTMASSLKGQLGSTTSPLRVFQDFFIDIDLPVALTQGDEISVPVAVYNYLPHSQTVTLRAKKADWFELLNGDTRERKIAENDVDVVYFPLKAVKNGYFKLTIYAEGEKMSDAIEREVRVEPNGREILQSINNRLEGDVTETITIPSDAIDGASNILVKVYPGIFSQVVEGLDKILQMPFGCFEQTSSTTYPNILALDYMKSTGQSNPEVQMKAHQYINLGYQRLLTFEVQGGGFSWFGNPPANKVLTAYGVLEFHDMARVYEIDPNLLARTQKWLADQQEDDGSWSPDESYLHAEAWGRIQNNKILPTAYILWALAESQYQGAQVPAAVRYLSQHLGEAEEAYTLALTANALVAADRKGEATAQALEKLVEMRIEEEGRTHWPAGVSTVTHSRGRSAEIETTALAAYALIKSGRYAGIASQALNYLIQAKDPQGTWGSTQATVLSLKALLASTGMATEEVNAEVSVIINGEVAGGFAITPENSDVLQQIDLKSFVREGQNKITLKFSGEGSCLYQIVGKYYLPWLYLVQVQAPPPLFIDVKYDRTELAKNDLVKCSVTVAMNRPGIAGMIIVDLGVPPGFEVIPADLEEAVGSNIIQKYSLTGRQIIVYLEKLAYNKPVKFSYQMRAKFPFRAKTPQSRAYDYYNPEVETIAKPVEMVVRD